VQESHGGQETQAGILGVVVWFDSSPFYLPSPSPPSTHTHTHTQNMLTVSKLKSKSISIARYEQTVSILWNSDMKTCPIGNQLDSLIMEQFSVAKEGTGKTLGITDTMMKFVSDVGPYIGTYLMQNLCMQHATPHSCS
jgi:hypothetical protein